jgi:opacity protein-like surface antigen
MYSKLMVIVFMLVASMSAVSHAQQDDYDNDVDMTEENVSRTSAADANQEDYAKSTNDASDTKNSPQINIYNANSNANKAAQKAKADAQNDALAEAEADAAAKNRMKNSSDTDIGADYISRANDIRRNRKEMEIGTEQKMVEKIEYSRIEDERDRANRLFGNRLEKNYNNGYNNNNNDYQDEYKKPQPQVIVVEKQPEYTPVVKPAPVVEKETAVTTTAPSEWWGKESYLAPMIGTTNYDAGNVRPDTAIGVAIGSRFDSNVSVEGSFLYSNLEMDDYRLAQVDVYGNVLPGLKDVKQYGFGLGVKYNFDMGRISPFVGALAQYTLRNYQETRIGDGTADSNAVDAGLNFGVDVKVAKNFSLGAEYRWMRNISSNRSEDSGNGPQLQSLPPEFSGKSVQALEEMGYSAFLVNGKFSF